MSNLTGAERSRRKRARIRTADRLAPGRATSARVQDPIGHLVQLVKCKAMGTLGSEVGATIVYVKPKRVAVRVMQNVTYQRSHESGTMTDREVDAFRRKCAVPVKA